MLTHRDIKTLILASGNVKEADEVISKAWCKSDAEKLSYVRQLFGYEDDIGRFSNTEEEYVLLLEHIVTGNADNSDAKAFKRGYDAGMNEGDPDGIWADICKMASMTQAEREKRFGYPYVDLVLLSTDLGSFREKMAAWRIAENRKE